MATYYGHVPTPADAVRLFEACRLGILPRVQCRLSAKETESIKSGSVFVWDEREAGIKRWTDGKLWSASRIVGSFLTYREVESSCGKDRFSTPAVRRTGKCPGSRRGSDGDQMDMEEPARYRVKPNGLIKSLFSLKTSTGKHLHLISYHTRQHLHSYELQLPTMDPKLSHIRPAKEMYPGSATTRGQLVKSSPYMPLALERRHLDNTPGQSKQNHSQDLHQDYRSRQSPTPTPPPSYQSPLQPQTRSAYTPVYQTHRPPPNYKAEGPSHQTPYDRSTPPILDLPQLSPSPTTLPPIHTVPHTTSPFLNLLLLPPTPTSLPPIYGVRDSTSPPLLNLRLLSPSPTPLPPSRRCSSTTPSINSISFMMNSTDSFPVIYEDKSDSSQVRMDISTENGERKVDNTLAHENLNAWVEDQRTIRLLDRTLVF